MDEENIPRCNKYYVTCINEIIFKYKSMLYTHLLKLTNLAFQGRTVADSHAFYLGKVHCRLLIFILSFRSNISAKLALVISNFNMDLFHMRFEVRSLEKELGTLESLIILLL